MASTPIVVHRLGVAQYGAYALCGVILSYVAFAELGLSRAVLRQGSAALGRGEPERLGAYYRAALLLQIGIGATVTLAIWIAAPLVLSPFRFDVSVLDQAVSSLRILAIGVGVNFVAGIAQAPLFVYERFALLNRVTIFNQTLLTAAVLLAVHIEPSVVAVVTATVACGVLRLGQFLFLSRQALSRESSVELDRATFRELLAFGGALTGASAIAPVLVHVEKLMAAALVGTTSLTYYMVPYRVLDRFSLVSTALGRALFPRLARLDGEGQPQLLLRTAVRATEILFWILLPMFVMVWVAGDVLLAAWMGSEFAREASGLVGLLAAGVFVNQLARSAVSVIQASGRPGLQVVVYGVELVLYVPLCWFLMSHLGVTGAALAWSIRVTFDAIVLWWLAVRVCRGSGHGEVRLSPSWRLSTGTLIGVSATALLALAAGPWLRLAIALAAAFATGWVGWFGALSAKERSFVRDSARGVLRLRTVP